MKVNSTGHIEVNEVVHVLIIVVQLNVLFLQFQDTNVEGIYALGDVCGKAELTPGMLLLCNMSLKSRLYYRGV